jgi:hypothetical protein
MDTEKNFGLSDELIEAAKGILTKKEDKPPVSESVADYPGGPVGIGGIHVVNTPQNWAHHHLTNAGFNKSGNVTKLMGAEGHTYTHPDGSTMKLTTMNNNVNQWQHKDSKGASVASGAGLPSLTSHVNPITEEKKK